MNKFLVVGLGNPEDDYSGTRHNIGFDIVNHLSKSRNVVMSEDRYGFIGKFKYSGKSIHILKPNTYMNLSVNPTRYWLNKLKIKPSNLIVIVDDLNLDFGKSRIRPSGKDGGHNGLKSIIEKLQTENFNRIRVGIGAPASIKKTNNFNTISYVLGNISSEEKLILHKVYLKINESLEQLNTKTEDYIMSELNSFDQEQA